MRTLINIFRIPELRKRVFFTLGVLIIYRLGFFIPLVGVDQSALQSYYESQSTADGVGLGRILEYASIFSGGSFSQSTVFGLGIMPYITAAIIFQLLQTAIPRLQELKKEGASGQQKITEWTRYTTVGMCLVQGFMWMKFMLANNMVREEFLTAGTLLVFYVSGLTALTAGSMFLMWLGEQIDKYGIGNGVSPILTAGIIAQMPNAITDLSNRTDLSLQAGDGQIGIVGILFLVMAFIIVVAGSILITLAQRRIPIQQARHTRGRKAYGGSGTTCPCV